MGGDFLVSKDVKSFSQCVVIATRNGSYNRREVQQRILYFREFHPLHLSSFGHGLESIIARDYAPVACFYHRDIRVPFNDGALELITA